MADAGQMIDGLALGETTPGPLIMVVAFIGFVGGVSQQALGPQLCRWRGSRARAWRRSSRSCRRSCSSRRRPVIESTHGELRFTAPLTRDHRGRRAA
jgi:chromate transporter